MNTFSVIIKDKTDNRKDFLFAKFFLELCGYSVLEELEEKLGAEDNKGLEPHKIVLSQNGECEINGHHQAGICVGKGTWAIMLSKALIEAPDEQEEVCSLFNDYYGEDMFRNLYTITYLYANRSYKPKENEIMHTALKSLVEECIKKEAEIEQGSKSWRNLYSYLYMVNRLNEGLFKIKGHIYRSHAKLAEKLELLHRIAPNKEECLLLEAEIIRNTRRNLWAHIDAYGKLQNASSYCARLWALYAMGELYRERADSEYREIHGDEDCRILSELHEPSIVYFQKALELKKDEVRLLFKLGLQSERKAMSDKSYMGDAEEKFSRIVDTIEKIPIGKRTTLEFEYLYKSYLRMAYVHMARGRKEEAHAVLNKAKGMWDQLGEYSLIEQIYGSEDKAAATGFLTQKYELREKTFEIIKGKIDEKGCRGNGADITGFGYLLRGPMRSFG